MVCYSQPSRRELVTDVVIIEQLFVTFGIWQTSCTFRTKYSNDRRNDNNQVIDYSVCGRWSTSFSIYCLDYRVHLTILLIFIFLKFLNE